MDILVIGLNHKTAGIEIRERIAFEGGKLEEAMERLRRFPEIKEHMILSTCNRVEIYTYVRDVNSGAKRIKVFLSEFHNVPLDTLQGALYTYSGRDAVRHVFRVASSLDSMIVGEPQILGQLKDSFDIALKKKTTGVLLNKLMRKAISVAKRVRTETGIAENAVSISFAAVELAKKIFEDLSTKTFMLIGAGEMAELAARHLINNGVKEVLVTNRTIERARELAEEFRGRVVEFERFTKEMVHADIVICSTGASHYILIKDQMQRIMKERKHRPVFIIDISVPRNIDPEINDIDNIYLYDIDDLQGVVDNNIDGRMREAEKASAIIETEVEGFLRWYSSLDAVPTLVALRQKAEAIRREELEKTLRKLNGLGEKDRKVIEAMTSSIVNKLMHYPTVALKTDTEDREVLVETVRRLFDLEIKEDHEGKD